MVGQERHLLQRRTLRLHRLSLQQALGAGAEGRWIEPESLLRRA